MCIISRLKLLKTGHSPLYSLSSCWWNEGDNEFLEKNEIQHIRLGHRGSRRGQRTCLPRAHTLSSRSLSRWLQVSFWSLYGPLRQAVLPTEGPSTRRCTPKPKEWTKVAVCRGCVCAWTGASSHVPMRFPEVRDSSGTVETKGREQMGGWCGNAGSLKILNGNLAFWAIMKVHLSKKDDNFFFFFFWPCHVAHGILVPQSGTEPCLLHWKHGVLTTESPGKSQKIFSLTVCFQKLFNF